MSSKPFSDYLETPFTDLIKTFSYGIKFRDYTFLYAYTLLTIL